ncbi:MAG: hypothetical protein VB119_09585 [Candidatus Metalachnospira sp.]|nr:hypothetical protein [Candidatus Metalachnospira sp.]
MGLFDNVAKKVGTVAGEAGSKAKDLAGLAKLSAEVGSKERDIEKAYNAIGKSIYENYKDIAPDDIKDVISAIDSLFAEIETLQEQIKELKK